jgi:hypothetical protein
MSITSHAFEDHGLGKAPYHFVRVIRHKGVEAVCDYCGKALRFECVVRSSDGKEFTVGRECIKKTGDFGLHGTIEAEFKRLEAEEQAALISQGQLLRSRPEVVTASLR